MFLIKVSSNRTQLPNIHKKVDNRNAICPLPGEGGDISVSTPIVLLYVMVRSCLVHVPRMHSLRVAKVAHAFSALL